MEHYKAKFLESLFEEALVASTTYDLFIGLSSWCDGGQFTFYTRLLKIP